MSGRLRLLLDELEVPGMNFLTLPDSEFLDWLAMPYPTGALRLPPILVVLYAILLEYGDPPFNGGKAKASKFKKYA